MNSKENLTHKSKDGKNGLHTVQKDPQGIRFIPVPMILLQKSTGLAPECERKKAYLTALPEMIGFLRLKTDVRRREAKTTRGR